MLFLPGSSAIALLLLTTTTTSHAFTFKNNPIHLTPTFQTTASTHPLHAPSKSTNKRGTYHRSSLADSGWKNDNFLDALQSSASPAASASEPNYDALETVNSQYNRESEGRAAFRQRQFQMMMNEDGEDTDVGGGGGSLDPAFGGTVDGMPASPPKFVPVEEESQGGEMFRKMMEKAEMAKAGAGPARAIAPPQPQQAVEQAPPPVAAAADPQAAYYQLQLQSWQQQMATYAQFIAANPEAAATMTMPPPPPPPTTTALTTPPQAIAAPLPLQTTTLTEAEVKEAKEKEARDYLPPNPNRNNDAYEITNSADVYLAQLKRDTAVRNWARQDGETDKSNQPFADVGVQAIAGIMTDELVQKRREQRANEEDYGVDAEQKRMIEGLQAEDNRRMEESEERDRLIIERGESGISSLSYKERLEQAKQKRQGVVPADEGSPPPQQPPIVVAPVTIPDPVESVAPPPPPQQPAVTVSPVTIADPVESVAPPQQQPAATVSPVTIPTDPIPTTTAPTPPPFPDMETPDAEEGTPQQPNFALPVKDESSIAPVSAPSSIDSDDTRKSLRTLMGYLLKHRGGPGFGSGRLNSNDAGKLEDALGEVLGMLRAEAGLEVEVEDATIEVEDVGVVPSSSSSSSLPRLDAGVLACVKGAVSAYENTQQEALLMPLRNALLSAASAINTVIAEGEVENARRYEAVVDTAPSSPPAPQQAQAVVPVALPVEQEGEKVIEIRDEVPFKQPAAQDIGSTTPLSNTARLQDAYDTLKASEGGGKFGLKKGISGSEISHVSEVLSDMRTLIMEELDTGITEPRVSQTVESGSTATSTTSAPSGEERVDVAAEAMPTSPTVPSAGGSSKYEQMLAKAKAEETAR